MLKAYEFPNDDPVAFLTQIFADIRGWNDRRRDLRERTATERGQMVRERRLHGSSIKFGERAWRPLNQACQHLDAIDRIRGRNNAVALASVTVLARSALLAAAKTVYILAPEESTERHVCALSIANAELDSEERHISAMRRLHLADLGEDRLAEVTREHEAARHLVGAQLEALGQKPGRREADAQVIEKAVASLVLAHPISVAYAWQSGSAAAHASMYWHESQAADEAQTSPAWAMTQLVAPSVVMTDAAWQLWALRRDEP